MEKIIGERGSGKTTKLLELCHEKGYVFVSPTFRSAQYAEDLVKSKGWDDVPIITAYQFVSETLRIPSEYKNQFVIDELDWFLQKLNVVGYSNRTDENKEMQK